MNEIIISFIAGSVWTLAVFLAGVEMGSKTRKIIEKNKQAAPLDIASKEETPKGGTTVVESGAVRAIKQEEIVKERQKGFINKMEELIKNES